ncbi:MAG TPA: cytochrome c maturation protein CcmE [Thermomicrobiales bacterium]|nr:cytochrome c maturation protein CcmE [Thermomicrobiales bacterium]
MSAETHTGQILESKTSGKPVWLNRKLMVAGAVLAIAVGFLIYNAMDGSAAFYMTVSELNAEGSSIQGQKVRVGGDVVDGSIVRGDIGEEIRFKVTDGVSTIEMVYNGDVPDIFADNAEVIATGTVGRDGVFVADELLTKCPSRFEADEGVSS